MTVINSNGGIWKTSARVVLLPLSRCSCAVISVNSSSVIHITHVDIVDVVVALSEDGASLLGSNGGNLNLAFEVVAHLLELLRLDLLLDERERIRHVRILILLVLDVSGVVLELFDSSLRVGNGDLALLTLLFEDVHLLLDGLLLAVGFVEARLQRLQGLHDLARVRLKLQQLVVSNFDVLDGLLVLDLKLMEVDKLEIITGIVLVLDLRLGLHNLVLQ